MKTWYDYLFFMNHDAVLICITGTEIISNITIYSTLFIRNMQIANLVYKNVYFGFYL